MRKNSHFKFSILSTGCMVCVLSLCCLFLTVSSLQAAGIKERMAARIPTISALKSQGVVGENNKGFLEFRTGNKAKAQLIADENKDRGRVYAAIAKKQGASPKLVGERRAKQIAQKGKKGQQFQKPGGSWYTK